MPELKAATHRKPVTQCPRGHKITGYNAKPWSGDITRSTCRACHATNYWARRNNLFNDDPRATAHADELIARYSQIDPGEADD